MTIFDIGDKLTVSDTVVNTAGQPTDDAGTTMVITAPDGTTTSPAPVHGLTGQYSQTVTATMAGNYLVRTFAATVGYAAEQQFYVQPQGFRIVGLTDAKAHINKTMTYSGDDNELRGFIDTAGELVDTLAGPTVNRTVIEYHSGPARQIFPRLWPVVSITSVVETWPGGPNYTLNQLTDLGVPPSTGYDFTFNPVDGSITRRVQNWDYAFPPGTNNIKLTYVAGRRQPWPAKIRLAALDEIAFLWRTSQAGRGAGRPQIAATDQTVDVAGFGPTPARVVGMLGGLLPPMAGA